MMRVFILLWCWLVGMSVAMGQKSTNFAEQVYFGGGLGSNELGNLDATGFQVFAGYTFDYKFDQAKTGVEVGYMDSGNFDRFPDDFRSRSANGLWATGLLSLPLSRTVELLGRAGLDFGDDDGFMLGGGVEVKLSRPWALRFEYVARDNIDALQANLVYYR